MPQSQVTSSSLIQLWATSSLLLRCKPSSEHAPDEIPVREIIQENQPFLKCSVLLTRPSTSGQKPVCDGKKTTPRKIECQPECTFPTALVDTSQPEHLYTFPASGLGRLKKKLGNYMATRSKKLDTHTALVLTTSGVELQHCLGTCSQASCGT